jgi:hypothetical protein
MAIMAVAVAIVILHRVDAFTNPQFYAEDGANWFADAYNYGPIQALGFSLDGYFQVLSRLGPVVAAPFGIANQPLIYNICGVLIQITPVFYFLTSRFDTLVPSFAVRVVLSAVYLLIPAAELDVDITSAPYHLAVLATLVLIAPKPQRWSWRAFDLSAALICGFSGPFAYVLLPVGLLCLSVRRERFTALLSAALAVSLAAQLYATTLSPRPHFGLGANLHDFFFIVSDRVILAGIFAEPGHQHLYLAGRPHGSVIAAALCLVALAVAAYAARKAPWELRLFGLAALGIAAAGLISPLVTAAGNQWGVLATTDAAPRYFFMAEVAWVMTLIWAASRLPHTWMSRVVWVAGAVAFASGFPVWGYAPFVNYHWPQEVRTIMTSAPGTRLALPIPPGGVWTIDITAR